MCGVLAWPKLHTYIFNTKWLPFFVREGIVPHKGCSSPHRITFTPFVTNWHLFPFLWAVKLHTYVRANLKLPNPMWYLTLKVKWCCNFLWNHLCVTAVKTSHTTVPFRGGKTREVEYRVIRTYSTLSCVCCLGPGTGLIPILWRTAPVLCSTSDKCRRNGCETKGGTRLYIGVYSI